MRLMSAMKSLILNSILKMMETIMLLMFMMVILMAGIVIKN